MAVVTRLLDNPLVRRLAARLGVPGAAMDRLLATMLLARPSEAPVPPELVPIGTTQVARALLTWLAVQTYRDWVWPYWVERQFDPKDVSFTGRGHALGVANVTHRNWTGVGLPGPDHPHEAVVDPRGLVTPWDDGWSWDVWVHAAGRLYAPSRMRDVEQRLSGDGLSVLTRFAAGPFAVEREVFMAVDGSVQEEVRIRAPRRLAEGFLVVATRPANTEGASPVRSVAWSDARDRLSVDGREALRVSPPADIVDASDVDGGDVAFALPGGRGRREARCRAGLAQAAAVWRVVLSPGGETAVGVASGGRPRFATARPEAARLLAATTSRAPVLRAPDYRIEEAWRANVRNLAILWDGGSVTPGISTYHHFWFRDAAYLTTALFKIGLVDEAMAVLSTYPRRQHGDGFFRSQAGEWDSNGQAIWASWQGYSFTRDIRFLERVWPSVRRGADWIARKRRSDPRAQGLLPPGLSAEHLGPNDWYYWDDLWGIAGLEAAAEAARTLGYFGEADRLDAEAIAFRADLDASLARAARRLGGPAFPASPYRRVDAGAVGCLAAVYPLRLMSPDDPRLVATVADLEARCFVDGGFFQEIVHSGTNPYLTAHFGQYHLARRSQRAWEAVAWHLRTATPTWTWPEAVHPRTGGGVMGDGHDGWSAADFLHLVRNLFVVEEGDRLVLFPASWPTNIGPGTASLSDAPTRFGRVSVSWSAGRIALAADWTVPPREVEVAPAGQVFPVTGMATRFDCAVP